MKLSEYRVRRRERRVRDRDNGCVFCKIGHNDGEMHRYIPSASSIKWRNGKPYACCEWHYMMMAIWATNAEAEVMQQELTEYLKYADDMRDF